MWIGIVDVLWHYEWRVTSSNLGRQNLTFIFTKFSLEWIWKGRDNLAEWGSQEGWKNHHIINIEEELKPQLSLISF